MTTEVTELLDALSAGKMTVEEVAQRFRDRTWPGRPSPRPSTYLEQATAALNDPDPDPPGAFSEVTTAYDQGRLTREQYRTLAEAAAESMRRAAE